MRSLSLAAGLLALSAAATHTLARQAAFTLPSPDQPQALQFASTSASTPASFAGEKVVRFSTASSTQHQQLVQHAHRLGLDVWAAQLGAACGTEAYGCVDVRLAADTHNEDPFRFSETSADEIMASLMQPFAGEEQIGARTMIEDLGVLVAAQQGRVDEARTEEALRSQAWHRDYHTFDEIVAYMHVLEQGYPGYARVVEIGKTHEGRPILALQVSSGLGVQPPSPEPPTEPQPGPPANATSSAKLGIVITGGQHAREWISTSASLFFASDLLHAALGKPASNSTTVDTLKKNSRKNRKKKATPTFTRAQARAILATFTLTVIPVANPDGYVYSWGTNRMWRKNRQPNRFPSGLFCKGVDLNRNYDYAFASSSATSACSEMYPGDAAFSAAEARAVAAYVQDDAHNVRAFVDLHSYGQLWMYPFSHSCDAAVADEEDLLELALGAVSALKRTFGRQFTPGKVCAVYAAGGGNAVDWAYASAEGGKKRVKWSYSVELRDGGTYGFLLPARQIVPASQEVGAALAYMLQFIARKDGR
ncbi:related to ECM14-involved in cell wall biogenesis and architecture [Sporisorium reilianum SRZ2]|uniref:Inactive metallocarboxypeptidase ECM14 n=1 Tax=Sporisorium reilianum (strain SRZ2) TaxID=999809 RepID=E6ZYJ7_SPORE|nr:related to ECM14-involved in cell wall biogenesis and architecture [Sporisorium reilianum SRZ2]